MPLQRDATSRVEHEHAALRIAASEQRCESRHVGQMADYHQVPIHVLFDFVIGSLGTVLGRVSLLVLGTSWEPWPVWSEDSAEP